MYVTRMNQPNRIEVRILSPGKVIRKAPITAAIAPLSPRRAITGDGAAAT